MIIHHNYSAEQIALGVDPKARFSSGQWRAICPYHQGSKQNCYFKDRHDGLPLINCFAGCTFGDITSVLIPRGLWPEPKKEAPPSNVHTLTDKTDMQCFCWGHEKYLKLGIPTTTTDRSLYRQYKRVLYSPFTPGEVVEMHMFCLTYSADVKRGETPTPEEDSKFMTFQKVTYEKGVPYAW